MLKSIEISGFKSFGKKGVLDFTSPISSIVGPNGSGKSNVAEAFRFVLGEQSIKSMRGKRAEDLIFNGGKDATRSNRASVKVVFNNSRRVLNIDFDEVSLERVVNRDSSSEYLINGSPVRLRDIIELLASAHIGSSGYHIISQGEADKILNANIRERRDIIEEALGLKIYQYKKEESQRKLEKTEENIKQTESLRREIAPHIRFLKKQVEKIEKTAQMKEDLNKFYHGYFKREELYIKNEKELIQLDRSGPEKEMQRLDDELKNAKEVLEKSSEKDEKSDKVVFVERQIKENRDKKDSIMRDIGRIEGEISSLLRLLKKQNDARVVGQQKLIELSSVENLNKSIELEIQGVETMEDLSKIKEIFRNIRKLLSDFISRNRSTESDDSSEELKKEIQTLEFSKGEKEKTLSEFVVLEQKLTVEYSVLKNEIEKEKDSNRDAEKALFRVVAEQNEIRSKLNDIFLREKTLLHNEEEFKKELQEASILVGVSALRYRDVDILNSESQVLTNENILLEERAIQEERKRTMEKMKIRLEDAGVSGSDEILKEYRETSERDTFLEKELEDLIKSSESLKILIKELEEKLTIEFKEGVNKINTQFSEFFIAMFGGGSASLSVIKEKKRKRKDTEISVSEDGEIEVEEEETEEGLDIEVSLPKKKIKGLMMLSGGERALTSIALIFAISQVNPPPFIILDETDAALDEANSKKYGDMIENLSKYSQLILITHNRETMSRAGIIYGVTMGNDGISRLLSIQFDEAVAVAK
jgi:chromosome segregation protein